MKNTNVSEIINELKRLGCDRSVKAIESAVSEELDWRSRDKYDDSENDTEISGKGLIAILEGKRAPSLCLSICDKFARNTINLAK